MKINAREIGDVKVIDIVGRISYYTGSAKEFSDFMRTIAEQSPKKVVINMLEVENIDSTGLGDLQVAIEEIRGRGGRVMLSDLTTKIEKTFAVTALTDRFEIRDTTEEAITAFA